MAASDGRRTRELTLREGEPDRDRTAGAIRIAGRALSAARRDLASTLSVLRTPGQLRRVLLVEGQSALGDSAAYVALLLVAYERLHSPWALSAVLVAERVPRMVLAPLAGVLGDRLSRRACLVGADLLRAGALVGIVAIHSFAVTVLMAALLGCGVALYRPVAEASLPALTSGGREAARAVSTRWTINYSGELLGPALAGLILLFSGTSAVLLLDTATFLLSAFVLSRTALGRGSEALLALSADIEAAEEAPARVLQMLREGAREARAIPGILVLILTVLSTVVAGGLMSVADPLLVKEVLRSSDAAFAVLMAAFGVGLVLGTGFSSPRGSIGRMRSSYFRALAVAAAGIGIMALSPTLPVALAGVAIVGAGNGLAVARSLQLIQLTVPRELIGRINGLLHAAEAGAFIVAFLAGGAAVALLGVRETFAMSAAGVLVASAAGFLAMRGPKQDTVSSADDEPPVAQREAGQAALIR